MLRRNFTKQIHQQEHERGKFQNPYFKHRRIARAKKKKQILVLFIFLLIASPIVFVFGPWHRLEEVDIRGLTTIPLEEVEVEIQGFLEKRALGFLSQKNILFLKQPALAKDLSEKFAFSSIFVDVKQKTLRIDVEEKISEVVWVTGEEMFFLDLEGVVLRPVNEAERHQIQYRLFPDTQVGANDEITVLLQPHMPIIFDDSNEQAEVGEAVLARVSIENIIHFDKAVRRLLVIPKTYGIEHRESEWLRIDTEANFDILFDASIDPEPQVRILQSILLDYKDLVVDEYIDLRFGNRVYTK